MLRSIRLFNWRSHKDTFIEFSKGTNLIVGIMGAGKSSILEALSFALFGTFPALERRKLKLSDIPRLNEQQASVVLEMQWNGIVVRLERSVVRSTEGAATGAKLFCDGKLMDSGPKAATDYITRLLSVDYDLFTRAIYSDQNNIDHFLVLGPGERKGEMDFLLGLDRFESARTSIVSVINRFRSLRKMLDGKFNPERLVELTARSSGLASECEKLKGQLGELKAALHCAEEALGASKERLAQLAKKKAEHALLATELVRTDSTIHSLQKELGGRKIDKESYESGELQLAALQGNVAILSAKTQEMEKRLSVLARESGALEARISTAESEEARVKENTAALFRLLDGRQLAEVEALQKQAENEVVTLRSAMETAHAEESELREALARLTPGISKCPLCSSLLNDGALGQLRHEKQAKAAENAEKCRRFVASLKERQLHLQLLSDNLKRARFLSEKIAEKGRAPAEKHALQERKEALAAENETLAADRKALLTELTGLQEGIRKISVFLNESKMLLRMKNELSSAEATAAAIRSSMSGLSHDEKKYEEAMGVVEQAMLACEKNSASLELAAQQLRHAEEMGVLVEKERGQLNSLGRQIAWHGKAEEELSIFKNALLETQTSLRESLTDAINTTMNEIWAIFYPYRNYRAVRMKATDRSYLFELHDGNCWKGLETVASGGERACAALTLRVAMAMVLAPNLSWLILDEPTHNLDKEAVMLLSETLQTKVPEVISQTVVITHDEALMGSEFARSYRLARNKDAAEPTQVERT